MASNIDKSFFPKTFSMSTPKFLQICFSFTFLNFDTSLNDFKFAVRRKSSSFAAILLSLPPKVRSIVGSWKKRIEENDTLSPEHYVPDSTEPVSALWPRRSGRTRRTPTWLEDFDLCWTLKHWLELASILFYQFCLLLLLTFILYAKGIWRDTREYSHMISKSHKPSCRMAQKQLHMRTWTWYCIKKSCYSFNQCLSPFIDIATPQVGHVPELSSYKHPISLTKLKN